MINALIFILLTAFMSFSRLNSTERLASRTTPVHLNDQVEPALVSVILVKAIDFQIVNRYYSRRL